MAPKQLNYGIAFILICVIYNLIKFIKIELNDSSVSYKIVFTEPHLLIETENYVSNGYSKSIIELNDDLFCPINIEKEENSQYVNMLKHIYRLQYPPDCDPQKRKFYIWKNENRMGLFANLNAVAYHFAHALMLNRTFLMYGEWVFYNKDQCKLNFRVKSSMECFFLPISNCTTQQVLHAAKNNKNVTIWESDKLFRLHKPQTNTYTHRFDVMHHNRSNWFRLHPYMFDDSKWLQKYYNSSSITVFKWRSLLESYILRMNLNISNQVNKIVMDTFVQNNISIQTASMILRWGDKCIQTGSPMAEAYCTTYQQYMNVTKMLKFLKPNLENIIATSDTKEVIINITKHDEYKKWLLEKNISLVINEYDIMPKIKGLNAYRTENYSYENVMVSILSTIKLHFASKYLIIGSRSNWGNGIADLVVHLNCHDRLSFNRYINDKIGHRETIVFRNQKWNENKTTKPVEVQWSKALSESFLESNYRNDNWDQVFNLTNIWTDDEDNLLWSETATF